MSVEYGSAFGFPLTHRILSVDLFLSMLLLSRRAGGGGAGGGGAGGGGGRGGGAGGGGAGCVFIVQSKSPIDLIQSRLSF